MPVPTLGRTGRRKAASLAERFGYWVADKGWIHVLLLTGVAICVYPFVWMILMSGQGGLASMGPRWASAAAAAAGRPNC